MTLTGGTTNKLAMALFCAVLVLALFALTSQVMADDVGSFNQLSPAETDEMKACLARQLETLGYNPANFEITILQGQNGESGIEVDFTNDPTFGNLNLFWDVDSEQIFFADSLNGRDFDAAKYEPVGDAISRAARGQCAPALVA